MSIVSVKHLAGICGKFLEAYNLGFLASQAEGKIESLESLGKGKSGPISEEVQRELSILFLSDSVGEEMISALDELIEANEALEACEDYLLDLCLLKLIIEVEPGTGEAYFESEEWLNIEDFTQDRGTELLNLLIYIDDCRDNNVAPDLEEFLFQFLLDDEETYQDEFFIYEPLIRNQNLLEGTVKEMSEAEGKLKADVLYELFTPCLLFFQKAERNPESTLLDIMNNSSQPAIHAGLFIMLQQFFKIGRLGLN